MYFIPLLLTIGITDFYCQQRSEEGFNQWEGAHWESHAGFSTEDIYVSSEYEGQHAEVVGIYLLTFCWTVCLSSFYSSFQPLPLHPTFTPYWYSLLLLIKMRWKVNLELLLKGIQVIPGLCDQLQEMGLWQATSGILKVSTHYFPEHHFSPVTVLILQQQWWASIWIQHTLPF